MLARNNSDPKGRERCRLWGISTPVAGLSEWWRVKGIGVRGEGGDASWASTELVQMLHL